jgi:hypothetical protein
MNHGIRSAQVRAVTFWMAVFVVVQMAWFFAEPQRARRIVAWIPFLALAALLGGLLATSRWLSQPMSPEVAAALEEVVRSRAICQRCGATRRQQELFCSLCHPAAERVIALVLASALLAASGFAWWTVR